MQYRYWFQLLYYMLVGLPERKPKPKRVWMVTDDLGLTWKRGKDKDEEDNNRTGY